MAWPPPVLPINRTNADAQQDTHPADHNAANLAINDLTAKVNAAAYAECAANALVAIPTGVWQLIIGFIVVGPIIGTGIRVDNSGLLIDIPGLYELSFSLSFTQAGTGQRGLGFSATTAGNETPSLFAQQVLPAGPTTHMKWSDTFVMPTGRVVMRGYQDSGATQNVQSRRITARRIP